MGTKRTQQKTEYNRLNYGTITVRFDKKLVDEFTEAVKKNGDSKAGVIKRMVEKYLETTKE